jgi:hypothetical protein
LVTLRGYIENIVQKSLQRSASSAMCEFVQTSMSRPQRKSGPTGRTAALLGEGERQLLSLGVWVKLIFPSFFWVMVTHPGHASLRSLVDAIMAPLQAYVGSAVESLALRRASRCAAANFGFFHRPRPVRDDPVRIGCWRFKSCHASHLVLTEFRAINPHPVEQDGEFAWCAG